MAGNGIVLDLFAFVNLRETFEISRSTEADLFFGSDGPRVLDRPLRKHHLFVSENNLSINPAFEIAIADHHALQADFSILIPGYKPDCLARRWSDPVNIALLDARSRKVTWVTDLKWEAFAGNFSPDDKNYTYTVNEDGLTDAYIADRSTNLAEKVNLPHGLNYFSGNPNEFAPQSDRLIISHEASNEPGDLWIYSRE